MNYLIIKDPPENLADYVKIPHSATREEFIKTMVGLLRQGTLHICTEPIPIHWAVDAEISAKMSHYLMMMTQVPVNFGELGTAHGVFYFERQPAPPKNPKKPN
jgi:hypothetical protein